MNEIVNLRMCCAATVAQEVEELPIANGEAGGPSLWSGKVVEQVKYEPLPRTRSKALHEAAHASIGFALGFTVLSVTIDDQCLTRFGADFPKGDPSLRASVFLAGRFAETRAKRFIYRPFDDEVRPYIEAARASKSGRCDSCLAAFFAADAAGGSASPEPAVLEAYRVAEVRTINLLQRPSLWCATNRLADQLLKEGTVLGPEAAEIFEAHGIGFGAFKNQEK